MCWTSKTPPVEQIAEVDIPIFKVCLEEESEGVISYYRYFKYELNHIYSVRKLSVVKKCRKDGHIVYTQLINGDGEIITISHSSEIITPLEYRIYQGFHSYSSKCKFENRDIEIKVFSRNKLVGHYHYSKALVVKGYIPKGAKYYENEEGEVVSEQIKIVKKYSIN